MPKKITLPLLGKFLTFLLIMVSFSAQAQKAISGKLVSKANQPLPGATITVKGTTVGTATDEQGNFRLTLPAGRNTLVISNVGFTTKEVVVGNETTLNISMDEDVSGLSEVVVKGYSSQQRKNIVGAVSTVKGEQLAAVQTGNVEQQFQGRVPGLTVITSGQPGTVSQVRIRGFGSFSPGGNDPLYVVDGIPTYNIDFLCINDGCASAI